MLNLAQCFQIIQKNTHPKGWRTAKELSENLCAVLCEATRYYTNDTFFNKLFTGANQGRSLFLDIQEEIQLKGLALYLAEGTIRLQNENAFDRRFNSQQVARELFKQIQAGHAGFSGEVQQGLIQSYSRNLKEAPHTFIFEVLFYSLDNRHNKHSAYHVLQHIPQAPQSSDVLTQLIQQYQLDLAQYSTRFISVVGALTQEEFRLFERLAQLVIWDEDDMYYLYAPQTDAEIAVYKQYGMDNEAFLLMEECGLINIGARKSNEMPLDDQEPFGFQNSQCVACFQALPGEKVTVTYKSYSFTQTGLALLEIIDFDTSESFLRELIEILQEQLKELSVKCFNSGLDIN
ncbi:DUF2806 domain-containing protein [Aerococcaceae bacterium NML180378]|nr:DUF2806 domain-containing protein [Aerococcaceae bacterium NML180378]